MKTKQRILSVFGIIALIAVPISASARENERRPAPVQVRAESTPRVTVARPPAREFRPASQARVYRPAPVVAAPAVAAVRPMAPVAAPVVPVRPVRTWNVAQPAPVAPPAWGWRRGHHEPDDDDYAAPGSGYYDPYYRRHRHHEPDADDYYGYRHHEPDADDYYGYRHHEPDADDYYARGPAYGQPYYYPEPAYLTEPVPAYYAGQPGLAAQRQKLVYELRSAYARYQADLRQGNRSAAQHMANAVRADHKLINQLDQRARINANARYGYNYNPYIYRY